MLDKFLLEEDCNKLIDYYKDNESKSAYGYHGNFPIKLSSDNEQFKHFIDNLNYVAKTLSKSQIDWMEIVRWPKNSSQQYHWDDASPYTTLSSIVFLNDNYEGGQTNYQEGTIFRPKQGRALFFDGKHYRHGVKKVENGERYTVATWYKLL
jgi:hypothetical protein|tara:strand:+ start:661 stop:1113 length:453 start_codon:yes stop_codon:yes gene_type:complete